MEVPKLRLNKLSHKLNTVWAVLDIDTPPRNSRQERALTESWVNGPVFQAQVIGKQLFLVIDPPQRMRDRHEMLSWADNYLQDRGVE